MCVLYILSKYKPNICLSYYKNLLRDYFTIGFHFCWPFSPSFLLPLSHSFFLPINIFYLPPSSSNQSAYVHFRVLFFFGFNSFYLAFSMFSPTFSMRMWGSFHFLFLPRQNVLRHSSLSLASSLFRSYERITIIWIVRYPTRLTNVDIWQYLFINFHHNAYAQCLYQPVTQHPP